MIAPPVTSLQMRERFQHALRHFDDFGECMFCQMLEDELQEGSRIVAVSEHSVALELYASPAPFRTHIHPRRHMASFGDASATEINDLARLLPAPSPSFITAWTIPISTLRFAARPPKALV
jgi:UDPglucose--hexose-1-phosphate uridylyltransferase